MICATSDLHVRYGDDEFFELMDSLETLSEQDYGGPLFLERSISEFQKILLEKTRGSKERDLRDEEGPRVAYYRFRVLLPPGEPYGYYQRDASIHERKQILKILERIGRGYMEDLSSHPNLIGGNTGDEIQGGWINEGPVPNELKHDFLIPNISTDINFNPLDLNLDEITEQLTPEFNESVEEAVRHEVINPTNPAFISTS